MKFIKDAWKRIFPGDIKIHLIKQQRKTMAHYRSLLKEAGLTRSEINIIEIIEKVKRTRTVNLNLEVGEHK